VKIATTKKLRGVLELPSAGIQISYDHKNDKPRVMTISDDLYYNNDVQTAAKLKFITLSKTPKRFLKQEDSEQSESILQLVNETNYPILLSSSEQQIGPKGSVTASIEILFDANVRKAIESGKITAKQNGKPIENIFQKIENPKIDEREEDATVAVVANPNKEKTHKTEKSIKKTEVTTVKKSPKETVDSSPKVYSPKDAVDEKESKKDEMEFVDKEQEIQRINAHPVLGKKESDLSDTEAVKSEQLDGTTPVVMKRTNMKKSTASAKTKKTASKKKMASKTSKAKSTRKKVVPKKEIKKSEPVVVEAEKENSVEPNLLNKSLQEAIEKIKKNVLEI